MADAPVKCRLESTRVAMKQFCGELGLALSVVGLLPIDGLFVSQNGGQLDRRLALPASLDRAFKSEIEAATSSEALEELLVRHPDQGQLLVPRIEALAVEEIKRNGPGERFVIPGLEPDEGQANSVTLQATEDRITLVTEFPDDTARLRFTDESVHRFIGRFPFADVVTLFGEGDKNHRLTFVVLDELGMVYIRGKGRAVTTADGKETTIQFGSPR